jgi:hypothetical protein
MPELNDEQLQVLTKAYETCHDLSKSNSEIAWSIRSWGIATWAALVAFGFQQDRHEIFIIAGVLLPLVLISELVVRQLQYAFIERALQIEHTFNDVLVGSPSPRLPPNGVSTNIATPSLSTLISLLGPRRWLIWFPYLLLELVTLAAFVFG